MAPATQNAASAGSPSDLADLSSPEGGEAADHGRIAQAVAKLLHPTVMESVETALHKSIHSIKGELASKEQQETEHRISILDDDLGGIQASHNTMEQAYESLLDKLYDLENRLR